MVSGQWSVVSAWRSMVNGNLSVQCSVFRVHWPWPGQWQEASSRSLTCEVKGDAQAQALATVHAAIHIPYLVKVMYAGLIG